MKFRINKKWLCLDCNYVFESDDSRWHMDYCPKCNKNAVDHEQWYVRIIGNVFQVHGNTKTGQKPVNFTDKYYKRYKQWLKVHS